MRHTIRFSRGKKVIEDRFYSFANRTDFQKDIQDIRKLWGSTDGFEFENIPATGENPLKDLLKKYALSPSWGPLIDIYILTGKFEPRYDPEAPSLIIVDNRDSEEILPEKDQDNFRGGSEILDDSEFYIQIFPSTTSTDLKLAYKKINRIIHPVKRTRERSPKNAHRDQIIGELRQKGVSYKKIATSINDNFPGTNTNVSYLKDRKRRQDKRQFN